MRLRLHSPHTRPVSVSTLQVNWLFTVLPGFWVCRLAVRRFQIVAAFLPVLCVHCTLQFFPTKLIWWGGEALSELGE